MRELRFYQRVLLIMPTAELRTGAEYSTHPIPLLGLNDPQQRCSADAERLAEDRSWARTVATPATEMLKGEVRTSANSPAPVACLEEGTSRSGVISSQSSRHHRPNGHDAGRRIRRLEISSASRSRQVERAELRCQPTTLSAATVARIVPRASKSGSTPTSAQVLTGRPLCVFFKSCAAR